MPLFALISEVTFDLENGKKTIELEKALIIANLLGLDVELNERG